MEKRELSAEEQNINPEVAAPEAAAEATQTIVEAAAEAPVEAAEEQTATVIAEEAMEATEEDPTEEIGPDQPVEDPEAVAESIITEAVEDEQAAEAEVEAAEAPVTKAALISAAHEVLLRDAADIQREDVSSLRQQFNAIRKTEIENARTAWAEAGGAPEAFVLASDPEEETFNALIAEIRTKREAWAAEQEKERQANLAAKNEIIDKINALAEDTDNVNRTFPLYRELQDQFNAIGKVPDQEETSVWKRFTEAREHYSDNLKINKELRDYDFKKNLDTKLLLVDEALTLADEPDIIVAFRRLQTLHEKWREIGPVAKELREEIWMKFQDASSVIRKKYQAFFEERKAREAANEAAKTALCEEIEALDFGSLASFSAWDEMTSRILDLQAKWKTLGFASKKVNNALFARFRQRCDDFFTAKAAYFKAVKEEYAANLARKTALVERAEALKDSTEWRKAADEFVALQKEWKTIGAVPKKHSDAIWKRFLAACDYFFEKKKQAGSGQRSAEQANLKAKRAIIDDLRAISDDTPADEAVARMRELQEQWQQTGHVPFRDKDKVNEAYRSVVNDLRHRLNLTERRAGMERFTANIAEIEGDRAKLFRERERLVRALENRRNEIRTYENNIGFLTSKSITGQSLVNDFLRKIEHLKEDIAQIEEKIGVIDAKL